MKPYYHNETGHPRETITQLIPVGGTAWHAVYTSDELVEESDGRHSCSLPLAFWALTVDETGRQHLHGLTHTGFPASEHAYADDIDEFREYVPDTELEDALQRGHRYYLENYQDRLSAEEDTPHILDADLENLAWLRDAGRRKDLVLAVSFGGSYARYYDVRLAARQGGAGSSQAEILTWSKSDFASEEGLFTAVMEDAYRRGARIVYEYAYGEGH